MSYTKEERREWQRNYYLKNKDKIASKQKEYNKKDNYRDKRKEWKSNNRDKVMETQWKRMGIKFSYLEYLELYAKQNGKCAICCKEILISNKNNLGSKDICHLDHNHINGNIRGLLCSNCNLAIGLLKDDIIILTKAINYLSKEENE